MIKMRIVGFCGFARSGKDTAAQLLLENTIIKGTKQKFSFAHALRIFAARLNVYFPELSMRYNDIIDKYGYETAKAQFPFIRQHLVNIGHGARLDILPTIWIDSVDHQIKNSTVEWAFLTDVRYLNEAEYIINQGGIVIYIDRPGVLPANETEEKSIQEILEHKLILVVKNDSDISEFENKIIDILNFIQNDTL